MILIRNKHWKDKQFNGSKVTKIVKPCLTKESPYDDYNHIHKADFHLQHKYKYQLEFNFCWVFFIVVDFFRFYYEVNDEAY